MVVTGKTKTLWKSGETHKTRLRKGVRVGCEVISDKRVGSMGAGDGILDGVGRGAPMAVRMSACWPGAGFLTFFPSGAPSSRASSLLLLFSPLGIFPRTVKLRRSNSTRSTLPLAMASPS